MFGCQNTSLIESLSIWGAHPKTLVVRNTVQTWNRSCAATPRLVPYVAECPAKLLSVRLFMSLESQHISKERGFYRFKFAIRHENPVLFIVRVFGSKIFDETRNKFAILRRRSNRKLKTRGGWATIRICWPLMWGKERDSLFCTVSECILHTTQISMDVVKKTAASASFPLQKRIFTTA